MAEEEDIQTIYDTYKERQEKKNAWYKNIPIKAVILLGILAIVLVIIFVRETTNKELFVILGGVVLLVILITLKKSTATVDYISEGEALKIVYEYTLLKKEIVSVLEKATIKLTGVVQLREWDVGQGMQPWRYAVAWTSVKNMRKTKWLTFVDPYNGKIIGSEILGQDYKGMERPNIKVHFPFTTRAQATFQSDIKSGRSKW